MPPLFLRCFTLRHTADAMLRFAAFFRDGFNTDARGAFLSASAKARRMPYAHAAALLPYIWQERACEYAAQRR